MIDKIKNNYNLIIHKNLSKYDKSVKQKFVEIF